MTSEGFLSPAALMARHELRAKKSWGQCFLHDRMAVQRIVEVVAPGAEDTVVEIGAGLGALTSLLAPRAGKVIAIERDRDLVAVLRQEFAEADNVQIEEANALTFDFSQFDPPAKMVGNLPYNISSPLIFHLLAHRRGIATLTVMLQKELADRFAAGAGSKLYGAPTVTISNLAEVRACFKVGKGAFVPAPQVDSAVIQLVMRQQPLFDDSDFFARVVRAAFSSRRKKISGAMAVAFPKAKVREALSVAGIDEALRAEALDTMAFVALASALAELLGHELDHSVP